MGSIGSFACGLQKKANTHAGAYAHAVKHGKAAYLEIYANLQQGKTYFSITTKEGVQQYVDFRKRDVELGHILSGRLATIATHLQHWLSFIGKDTKLKELERTDCENYFYHRQKPTDSKVKQVTVQNEQSTINACIKWLNKDGVTRIDGCDFRNTWSPNPIRSIQYLYRKSRCDMHVITNLNRYFVHVRDRD